MISKTCSKAIAAILLACVGVGAMSACAKKNELPKTLTEEQKTQLGFNVDPVTTTDILVSANDPSVFTEDTNIVSSHGNMYVLSYNSVEEAAAARSYYADKTSGIADFSGVAMISEGDPEAIPTMEYVDSISILNSIELPEGIDFSNYIAVIDTGADTEYAYSVIGEDTGDNFGHGSAMVRYILEENPNANIVSIKVSEDGFATAADIYAGIELAKMMHVSVINFSMTALDIEKNAIVKTEIQSAIDSGITFIGAAGNESAPASYFIPGCIDAAIVVGSANDGGSKFETSNYGVDYYVEAFSTSEATARFAGIYTAGNVSTSDKVYTDLVYDGPVESITGLADFEVAWGPDAGVAAGASTQYTSSTTLVAGTYYGQCQVNIAGSTSNGYSGSSASGFNAANIPGHSGNSQDFANLVNGSCGSMSIACAAAWTDGEKSSGDGWATNRFFSGIANYKAISDGHGNITVYFVHPSYDPDTTTSSHMQTINYSIRTTVTSGGSQPFYRTTISSSDPGAVNSTYSKEGGSLSAYIAELKTFINSKYSGKENLNIDGTGVGSFSIGDFPCGQKFRGDLYTGSTPPPPGPGPSQDDSFVYHVGAGKSMDATEWNDLVSAYGEDYVRSHISIYVTIDTDGCFVVTDIGPDGVYGLGPGEDGKYGDQYYYGTDGTTRVGPDGRANTADDNQTYNDDINDDTYGDPIGAGSTVWSGTLVGLNTHAEGSQIIFEIPTLPTNGVYALPGYAEGTISFTVHENSAFEASH